MDVENIKDIVEDAYDLKVTSMERIKNVYKICSESKYYCLKIIRYEFGHFIFIVSAIEHLQNNGFEKIPEIIINKFNKQYVELDNCYAYLTEWIDARECNYQDTDDITVAVTKLAELHIKSEDFNLTEEMNPRIGWLKWIDTFNTRKNEILDFKARIEKKEKRTEVDEIYRNMMGEELSRAESSINDLIDSEYISTMCKEINKRGFCHHDFAHHNVLIDQKNQINIIDFDYCMLDSHLHDLSSILIRSMKNKKWEIEKARYILDAYNETYKIENSDIPIIASFIEFPQEYWQVGIQYYWEKKEWGEEFFKNKLFKILEDRGHRQDFVDELMTYKYRGD